MDKREIVTLLNETLVDKGFKKKGDFWVDNRGEIVKMVNLQKSNFGNRYYVNYGYILKSIPLKNEVMHVYNRLTSADARKRGKIERLLNLETEISDDERIAQLKDVLIKNLLTKIQSINSEEDIFNELKNRPNLNAVPVSVKKYFKLE